MKANSNNVTPPYIRYLAPLIRPFPDFDFGYIRPVRRKAVELLNLKAGDRVLDVGCGPGGCFPYLIDAVGPDGEVIGVEISPEVVVNARNRIEKNGWKNVRVIESAAKEVKLSSFFDGLLMFAAADAYASSEALDNLVPYLRDTARVAAFGAKITQSRMGLVLNPVLRMLFNLSFSTTPRPDREPWRTLAKYFESLDIEEYFFGLMFLVSGSLTAKKG